MLALTPSFRTNNEQVSYDRRWEVGLNYHISLDGVFIDKCRMGPCHKWCHFTGTETNGIWIYKCEIN